ncbi:MAG: PAS domain S-box protein [Deltaproteobacteria bacterium]|nr:PAS domain S-box protein [Deltaproteobacteria bacterium]MBW1952534.1 PAS domain S-box protein [Deltaproteobacteria bacterium]MBW1987295.1 PAS domain S-box protein [Deltaproteobacteria bacterium]MBW2135153.1 PAS domain S-box protein [Deltaproteobacteria bacterium]
MDNTQHPLIKRYFIALLMGIALAGFIAFLIGENYLSQVELQKLALKNLRQDLEKRAAAVSYFYSERKQDLRDLAHSREISLFFENKALGMSMEYGLRASLIAIQKCFDRLRNERHLGPGPIYTRIVFIDSSGECLVDSRSADTKRQDEWNWQQFLAPEGSGPVILVKPLGRRLVKVMVSTPYVFKGTYAGQIIAWVSTKTLYTHLIAGGSGASNLILHIILLQPDGPYLDVYRHTDLRHSLLPDLGRINPGESQGVRTVSNDRTQEKMIALWVPIHDTPFCLHGALPITEVFGSMSPWHLPVVLGSLALLLLGGIGIIWRSDKRNLDLQARLVEASKREREIIEEKNRQLEAEIAERKLTEEALRASEERLTGIIQSVPDHISMIDEDHNILFVNEVARRLFGPDLVGKKCYAVYHRREEPCESCLVSKVFQDSQIHEHETEVIGADGQIMYLWRCAGVAGRHPDGRPKMAVEVSRDITARKQAEQALRESEEFRNNILINSSHPIVVINPDTSIRYVNPALERLTGFSSTELIGQKAPYPWWTPETVEKTAADLRAAMGEGTSKLVEIFRNKDEQRFWVEINSTPIRSNGEFKYYLANWVDITDRKLAEEVLKLNESRLEALLRLHQLTHATPQEIINFALEEGTSLTKSRIGYLAFTNEDESVLTMYGWSKSAMAECRIADKPIDYPVETTGLWGEAIRQRQPIITNDYTAPNPWKKGYPEGHVEIRRHMNVPIFEGNHIVLVAGVGNKPSDYDESDVRQLTLLMAGMWRIIQRQQAEELIKASLREKEVLLKEIHHRVKNNMQIISSLLKLQAGYADDPKVCEVIQDSQNRIKIMALVHELLYQSPDLARIDLPSYIKTLVEGLYQTYRADSTKIALKLAVEDVHLGVDIAIPCGLIINELVSNSLKYAFPDHKKGEINLSLHSMGDQKLELIIRDNGVGLPEDFDFNKAESLGLHLVHILIEEQLQGKIRLNRTGGTEFIIEFSAKR